MTDGAWEVAMTRVVVVVMVVVATRMQTPLL
jgi:hypothetical protein